MYVATSNGIKKKTIIFHLKESKSNNKSYQSVSNSQGLANDRLVCPGKTGMC